jgi:hypothetical protein
MNKAFYYHSLSMTICMLVGCIFASAKVIIPLGNKYEQPWEARYFFAQQGAEGPTSDWYETDFNDSRWETLQGPICGENGGLTYYNTVWAKEKGRYWVRHHFNIDKVNADHSYYLLFSHDDECQVYINGILITNQSGAYSNQTAKLSAEAVATLKKGDNVLCMYVSDSGGGGQYLDFGLYEDDGDFQDIVQSSDVQISFSNDKENPWWINGWGEAYNGNRSKTNSTSWLQMTFSSTLPTELKFDWYSNSSGNYHQPIMVYIDGVLATQMRNSSWTTPRFYIEPGDHVIAFRDSIGNSTSYGDSGLRNIRLRQLKSVETAVLTDNSQKLTFINNSATPWTIEDGYIEHNNYGVANTASTLSTKFKVTKTSKLSYDRRVSRSDNSYNYEDRHNLVLYVNGIQYQKDWNLTDFSHFVVVLEPGDYTIEWKDTVYNYTSTYYSQIKNIELSNNWVNVELATAGTLGYEVLYSGGMDVLTDVEFLKIKGPMNTEDWKDIKNMTNLLALDLSEADIKEIPNNAFDGKTMLNSVIMPEGITRIGEYAFRGTTLRRVNIPSTVTVIERNAFAGTPINYLTFTEGSQLQVIQRYAFQNCKSLQEVDLPNGVTTIGYSAFDYCSAIKSVKMPNSVTSIAAYAFEGCTSMKSIYFSDGLTEIYEWVCYGCSSLTDIHFPKSLTRIDHEAFRDNKSLVHVDFPKTLVEIDYNAFYNCALDSVKLPINLQWLGSEAFSNNSKLRYVEFPSYLERGSYSYRYSYQDGGSWSYTSSSSSGYRSNFRNCPELDKIVLRSATPPAIDGDPFDGSRNKKLITLVVPSFSVVNYKLDAYWYQFGTIAEGDDVDYWKITSPLMLTNNRRMQGTPDVDLYYDGQFTVGGSAPMPIGHFNMFVNESNPGRLLNTCEAMSAEQATTIFSVDANKWYFFTPLYDVPIADIDVSNEASYVFRYYDAKNRATNGASGSWKNVDGNKLIAGQGYIFHCNKACTITFPADEAGKKLLFNTKDVRRTLTVNEATESANRSWNYIGNPYPCYYDIYYLDFTAPITVWNGSTYKAYSVADDEFVLRPMQSFFVQKPDAVDEIIFQKDGRQLTTAIAHGATARMTQHGNRYLFNLEISNKEQKDETRVVINNKASLGYEIERDAAKFMSFEANVPQIYTIDTEGNSYAINERPMADGKVQLAYYAGKEDVYTIRTQRTDGTVYLHDADQNITVNLTKEDYTFQSEATDGTNDSRFTLIFMTGSNDATGIREVEENLWKMESPAYDLQGRKVYAPQKKGIFIQNGKKVVR